MFVEFWALPPAGVPVLLAEVMDWTISPIAGGRGTVALTYPRSGRHYQLLLDNTVGDDRDLEVEIRLDGSSAGAQRVLLTDSEADVAAEAPARSFTGVFYGSQRLEETVLFPVAAGLGGPDSVFAGETAGGIVDIIVDDAQARGALTDIDDSSFGAVADSNGQPWPDTVTIKFSPGKTYLAILEELEEAGLCEWEVTAARELRLYVPGTMGVDRTTGPTPLRLQRGRDVRGAPSKHSVRASVTALLGAGGEGAYADVSDASALARRGRRIEGFVTANGITSVPGLIAHLDNRIATLAPGVREITHDLVLGTLSPRPLLDYGLRDTVLSDRDGSYEALRVQQIVLQRRGDEVTAQAVVGDLIAEYVAALNRRLRRISDGGAVVGTSESPSVVDDSLAPAAPTGLVLATDDVPDGQGGLSAIVTAGWAAPTTNSDSSPLTDLAGYELRWSYADGQGLPTGWNAVGPTLATTIDISVPALGADVIVQVLAYDRAGNRSTYSAAVQITTATDTTGPPVLSTPTAVDFNGVGRIGWDGLGSAGEPMPVDFDVAHVHVSTSAVYTPDATTKREELRGAGETIIAGLTYGVTYYIRLLGYDRSGNPSPSASGTVAFTPQRLVGDDLADGLITAAKLGAASVTSPAIQAEAVRTPHLSVAAFSDNEIPNGSFEDVDLTDATKPANWVVTGTNATAANLSLDTIAANVHSGSRSAKVTFAGGAARHLLLNSAWIPTRPGEVWYFEVVAKASRVHAGLTITVDYASGAAPPVASVNDVRVLNAAFATTFTATEVQSTAPATAGGAATRWVRFKVETRNNDSAAIDVWWDELRARKVVGTAEIALASIGSAQIGVAAIQDANVANLSVAKLTSGVSTATITNSGLFQTNALANRGIKIDSDLRAWNSSGVQTFFLSGSTGVVEQLGKLTAGASLTAGDRVILDPAYTPPGAFGSAGARPAAVFSPTGVFGPAAIFSDNSFGGAANLVLQSGRSASGATFNLSQLELIAGDAELGTVNQAGARVGGQIATTPLSVDLSVRNSSGSTYLSEFQLSGTQMRVAIAGSPGDASRFTLGNAGMILEILDQAASPQRDGGFLWLGKGNAGTTYFGKRTSTRDKYLAFLDTSTLLVESSSYFYTIGDLRHQFVVGGVARLDVNSGGINTTKLASYQSANNFRAVLQTDDGPEIMFYWSGGQLNIGQNATGTFIKTFVIDHPLDPARHLVHGVTESPHAGVEYWGVATVEDGQVEVELPSYFEALTRRTGRVVQVTVLAEEDPADRTRLSRRRPRTGPLPGRPARPEKAIRRDERSPDLPPLTEDAAAQAGGTPLAPPAGLPSLVQATYPRNGRFTIFAQGPVDTFRVMWLVKAIRSDVPELQVEPLRAAVQVRGDGPYTYPVPLPDVKDAA